MTAAERETKVRAAANDLATCEPESFPGAVADLLVAVAAAIGTRYAQRVLGAVAYDVASRGV